MPTHPHIHPPVSLTRWAALAAVALLAPTAVRAQCKVADDLSVGLTDQVTQLVTTTDPDEAARRADYGLLTASASQVTLETDSRTCSRVLTAYNGTVPTNGAPAPTAVYVLRVGSGTGVRYVVTAAKAPGPSEFAVNVVLDSKYAIVGKFSR